jgi:hypothetical protein
MLRLARRSCSSYSGGRMGARGHPSPLRLLHTARANAVKPGHKRLNRFAGGYARRACRVVSRSRPYAPIVGAPSIVRSGRD